MSKTIRNPVFSPALQRAYERARPTLEGVEDARNQVSHDIKELESYLVSLPLTTPFRLEFGKRFVGDDDVESAIEHCGSAFGQIEQEALVWSEHASKWRLLYEVVQWNGHCEPDMPGGPLFCDEESANRQVKPLIETKLDVRQRMHERLAEFLQGLANEIALLEHLPCIPIEWDEGPSF